MTEKIYLSYQQKEEESLMSHYGHGYVDPCHPYPAAPAAAPAAAPFGGFALVLVLFILLVIIGAAWTAY